MRSASLVRQRVVAAAAFATFALVAAAPLRAQSSYDPVTADPPVHDSLYPPSIEELALTSDGGARMNALLYVAQGKGPHPTVVLLHGYPGNERNLDLAQAMRRAGMNVLFFSYRGAWGSGGTFSFANAQADVAAALRWARSPEVAGKYRADPARVALVGHSMGGWLALLGAAADTGVRCVGGIEFADMARRHGDTKADSADRKEFEDYTAWLTAPGGPLHATESAPQLVRSLEASSDRWSLPGVAPALRDRTVLLLDNTHNHDHAPMVEALRRAGASHVTALVWPTDHSFSDRRIELARTVVGWLRSGCGY
jgi:pimeloyl-ACP methyl ester carboxylesterase